MGNVLKRYNGTSWEAVGGTVSITGDTLPIGSIVEYDGVTIPAGWEAVSGTNKIEKISQVAGFVGTVSNSTSDSTTATYSCDYTNKLIKTSETSSNTATYSCNYIDDCNTYNTTETFTGKYWNNGEKIYRKVVEGTLPSLQPGSGTVDGNVAHGISNLGTVVSITGWLVYNNVSYYFPILASSGKITTIRYVDSTNIVLRSSEGWSAGPAVVFIMEYTKSS